jgi:ADP-ribose pyrophosphatase YjhB (NUDIX family)
MSDEHFVGKVSVRALIIKDGKALISRDVFDLDTWDIPGGRLHLGENPEDGVRREVMEELGVEIILGKVVYTEQFKQTRTGDVSVLIAFEARLKDENAQFVFKSDEIVEAKWITKEQLFDQKIYENCLNALKKYFQLS